MQPKILLVNIFIALAVAAPAPAPSEQAEDITGLLQGTATATDAAAAASGDGGFSAQALKNWQAAGGCKSDWDEDNRCLNQCIGEANGGKCPRWKTMQGWIQGGCLPGWNTCRCNCEY
jgi:hypothetical protein